ncbi:MAG: OmpH family outer membrane protein [Phycisphaeraceae bacterium]|nr:OmpH family outer membrane protein [Phycisphaeraceae bacterium]
MRATWTTTVLAGLTATILAMAGCGQAGAQDASSGGGGVAVVDLDALAKAIGRDVALQQEAQAQAEALNKEMREQAEHLSQTYTPQLQQMAQSFGPNPTPEQRQKLAAVQQQAAAEVEKLKMEVLERRNKIRSDIIAKFRAEILPAAQQVAAAQGLKVVLVKGDQILLFDTAVDITSAIAQQVRQ